MPGMREERKVQTSATPEDGAAEEGTQDV